MLELITTPSYLNVDYKLQLSTPTTKNADEWLSNYSKIDGVMERLDQGHLHPKLEVPGLTCPGRASNPGLLRGRRTL